MSAIGTIVSMRLDDLINGYRNAHQGSDLWKEHRDFIGILCELLDAKELSADEDPIEFFIAMCEEAKNDYKIKDAEREIQRLKGINHE